MKLKFIAIILIIISWGIASSQDIISDDIVVGNITSSDQIADRITSSLNDSANYTFIKDIGNAKDVEVINVHFKNAFRYVDQNVDQDVAIIDRVWQVSDTNSSLVLENNSDIRLALICDTPLKLEEGYELAIVAMDLYGHRLYVQLSKNAEVVDAAVIASARFSNTTVGGFV